MATEKDLYAEETLFGPGSANDVESDPEKIIGAQITEETTHEIKYRTCSWQKVSVSCTASYERVFLSRNGADRRTPLLRVHMSSYLILSMVRHTIL